MAQALLWGALTFVIALLLGDPLIGQLRRIGIGKTIRTDGPASHQVKMGTPTMGGLMILAPVLVVNVAANLVGRYSILLPLGVMVAFGVLGLYDDWCGIHDRSGVGMLARLKFPWQVLIGLFVALSLRFWLDLGGMAVPTLTRELDISTWYILVAAFFVVGFANAVNLTDGLDGLAGGLSAIAYGAFGIIAYLQKQMYLATLCFTVLGAVTAFLWYNVHPARLFMGDVGALALGATLATVALMTEQWLLLPLIGIVFVVETSSVILQVLYFKLTHGKRLFRMAPLHHHLELSGWEEVQITQRFWLLGAMAAMLGIALALL